MDQAEVDKICEGFVNVWEPEIRPESEVDALAICFARIGNRGKRSANLWSTAVAVDYLVQLYGGRSAVARAIGVSYETIREYHVLLKLPPLVKMMLW